MYDVLMLTLLFYFIHKSWPRHVVMLYVTGPAGAYVHDTKRKQIKKVTKKMGSSTRLFSPAVKLSVSPLFSICFLGFGRISMTLPWIDICS